MEVEVAEQGVVVFGRGFEGRDGGLRVFVLHVDGEEADVGAGVDEEGGGWVLGYIVAMFGVDFVVDEFGFFWTAGIAGEALYYFCEGDGHACGIVLGSGK